MLGTRRGTGHGHDFAELFLVAGTGLGQNCNGRTAALPSGTVCLLTATDWHELYCDAPEGAAGELINVAMRSESLEPYRHLWHDRRQFQLPPAAENAVKSALAELERDSFRRAATLRYFLEILHYWLARQTPETCAAAMPDWLRQAVHRAENAGRIPTYADFIRWCGRCGAHVGREMEKSGHGTVSAWLNQLRLARALRALRESALPIAEIAAAAGFRHESSFHRAFRARYGLTPLRCRRDARNIVMAPPSETGA